MNNKAAAKANENASTCSRVDCTNLVVMEVSAGIPGSDLDAVYGFCLDHAEETVKLIVDRIRDNPRAISSYRSDCALNEARIRSTPIDPPRN